MKDAYSGHSLGSGVDQDEHYVKITRPVKAQLEMPLVNKDLFSGTGGVEDVEAYLSSRKDLHLKIAVHDVVKHLDEIFASLDSGQFKRFLSYFHAEASFRFGSQPIIHGIENIRSSTESFFQLVHSIQHHINKKFVVKDQLILLGHASYHMKNGVKKSIPFCDVWKIDMNGKIKEYWVYCDPTGLFSVL